MTRIDCPAASANRVRVAQYIGGFVERQGREVLIATDEEWNDHVRLDAESAAYLGKLLLEMAEEIRRGVKA